MKNEKDLTGLKEETILREWWNYMSDIMEVNPDNSPVEKPLKEVFYMDYERIRYK